MSVEITPELLADLREKAEAYELHYLVGKDWFVDGELVKAGKREKNEFVAETVSHIDADYIAAANPAVVLALVAEIERLRDRPRCKHWLDDPERSSQDYARSCSTINYTIDMGCEPPLFCEICGGEVEIVDAPEDNK